VWIVRADGGALRRVTSHPKHDDEPSFSHDGHWIYFTSNRTGRSEIYRVPFAGGKEEQVTTGGGSLAQESVDGEKIYYALTSGAPTSALMEAPVSGGAGRRLNLTITARAYHVTADGIYFLVWPGWGAFMYGSDWLAHVPQLPRYHPPNDGAPPPASPRPPAIHFYDFASRTTREVQSLPNRSLGRGLSVSADRQTFLYSVDEGTGWDLMLVENFQ
jgi:hypothetical protein